MPFMNVLMGLVLEITLMGVPAWHLLEVLDVLTLLPDRALLIVKSASRHTEGGHRMPIPLDDPKNEADLKADSA